MRLDDGREITFSTEPDELGRRRFTMTWYDKGGVFRPEPGAQQHGPVGFQRGQVFFADPTPYLRKYSRKEGSRGPR